MAIEETDGGSDDGSAANGDSTADDDSKKTADATPSRVNGWQFGTAFVVVAGLILIVLIVVQNVSGSDDSAVGVLGVIVPALATVGAAAFGVTSVYQAAKTSGEETGKAKGAAGKETAVKHARKQVASDLLVDIAKATEAHGTIVRNIRTGGVSPPGASFVLLGDPSASPIEVNASDLDDSAAALERLRAKCEVLLQD